MNSHDAIWRAMDGLAREHGMSPSGLAKRAGLDPTSFNVSKRSRPDGHLRWPTMSSILSALAVTETSFVEFAIRVEAADRSFRPTAPDRVRPKNGHGLAAPVDAECRQVA